MSSNLIFRQLFDRTSCTYTYILGDAKTREAIVIDSVVEQNARDFAVLERLNLKPILALETHCHADHVTGVNGFKQKGVKIGIYKSNFRDGNKYYDIYFADGDSFKFGSFELKVIHTPGHTDDSCTFHLPISGGADKLFTGDTILITKCGRTDFQSGSSDDLFNSVTKKLFAYPDDTEVWPGHDYTGQTMSTIAEEKKYNIRLNTTISREKFIDIMKNLNLARPAKIDIAVPANLTAGTKIPEVSSTSS